MSTSGVGRGAVRLAVGHIIQAVVVCCACLAAANARADDVASADTSITLPDLPPVPQAQASPQQVSVAPPVVNENPVVTTGAIPPAVTNVPPAPENSAPPSEITAAPPSASPAAVEPPQAVVEAPPPPPPPTPAEILGLAGKDRLKAEKCLANAVYFEARGEALRGQIAVAQVVMNRVFSPYYPKDVCSVVYQNAERHLACQFTFACDGRSKAINERGAWARAMRVAKQTLDGKVWLAAVAKATHYHAYWVSPAWVGEMRKLYRFGVHTFYRPQRWGDGEKEIGWVQAPLPVLKPKPQPVSHLPKPQATNTAPSAQPVVTQAAAAPANPPAPVAAPSKQAIVLPATPPISALQANAQAKNLPPLPPVKPAVIAKNGKVSPANTSAKSPAKSASKPALADKHAKFPAAIDQAKSKQKISLQ